MEELIESVVYSGSFNPFHIGHLEIVKHLSKRFDKVYLVVSVQNPLKTMGASNFNERLNNVRRVIKESGLTNVIVEDIETTIQAPYYTIKTLEALNRSTQMNYYPYVWEAIVWGISINGIAGKIY